MHLLETSLLYPLYFGSRGFKERVNIALAEGRRYTTHYVRMEFRRVALLRIAQFCLQLLLPSVRTADDLLADWANHFGARDAMRKLALKAHQALEKGLDAWTCRDCATLGDWIVTLDCPDFLQVEHLDHVYDYLCPSRGLAHRKHRPDRLDGKSVG